MAFSLTLHFPREDKELVLDSLYSLDMLCFQEGQFSSDREGAIVDEASSITCFFESESARDALVQALQQRHTTLSLSYGEIADTDWQNAWKEFSQPVEVSPRLYIRASWHPPATLASQQEIIIDPQMAFGSGSHATTFLCLKLIDELFANIATAPKSVLDVGCGSGILSIAADIGGATEILGIDIDPVAVEVSAENARSNAAQCCQFACTDLQDVRGTFDLLIANILSGTLLTLLDDLRRCLAPGGKILLSGILESEESDFLSQTKLAPSTILRKDGWIAVLVEAPVETYHKPM